MQWSVSVTGMFLCCQNSFWILYVH